jgi:hypothetical protein
MNSSVLRESALIPHPETPSRSVRGIRTRLRQASGGGIAITYLLKGQIGRLSVPERRTPSRKDGLWQHTCFEAFVSVKGAPEYHEFNFAPSGEWAAYTFSRYRHGVPIAGELNPEIATRAAEDRLELDAVIRGHCLPTITAETCLLLGLCAVIEEEDGVLSYWALKHPSGRPDFHHPDAFVLELNSNNVADRSDPAYSGKP